jgi:hypothetical protein
MEAWIFSAMGGISDVLQKERLVGKFKVRA